MSEGCAVAEADERVHRRRRVDHDLDPVVVEAEQEMRLEQLESLVGEGGRVDRDLGSHVPGRVCKRLGRRDVGELLTAPPTEGAARGGQHERMHGFRITALQALVRGRVLAVDGK